MLFVLCSEVETLKQKRQWELDVFWKQLDQDLNSGNKGSRLSDVARLNYNVKIHLVPQDKGNTEAMVNGEQVHFLLPNKTSDSDFSVSV